MSYGKMNTFIDIIRTGAETDAEGFSIPGDTILASVRAYHEGRHGTQVWANRAAFSEATDLFRFRVIPGLEVTEELVLACESGRFHIISAENVRGRGMSVEVLAKKMGAACG